MKAQSVVFLLAVIRAPRVDRGGRDVRSIMDYIERNARMESAKPGAFTSPLSILTLSF